MALLPLLWLGVLAYYGQRRSVLWWTLAIVLGVSWLADTAAHWVDPWLVSALYPGVQAILLGLVLLPSPAVWPFTGAIGLGNFGPMLCRGLPHPEFISPTLSS